MVKVSIEEGPKLKLYATGDHDLILNLQQY